MTTDAMRARRARVAFYQGMLAGETWSFEQMSSIAQEFASAHENALAYPQDVSSRTGAAGGYRVRLATPQELEWRCAFRMLPVLDIVNHDRHIQPSYAEYWGDKLKTVR